MDFLEKIIVGISSQSDIEHLLQEGFRQFYFGYVPQEYLLSYSSQISPNRRYRTKEQFTTIQQTKESIKKIKEQDAKVYLALNSFFANETILDVSKDIFFEFEDMVDGVIVANIPMLLFLKEQGYKNIVLSNLFGIYSCDSLEFFKSFNPKKVILPRDITIDELKQIVSTNKDIEFECFLYGDNCRYSEAFCFTEHGYDSIGFGSLCSFAMGKKKLFKAAKPSFKQTIKDTTLDHEEKKRLLSKNAIDQDSLLDDMDVALFEKDTKQIYHLLEFLNSVDLENFFSKKASYARAMRLISSLQIPLAKDVIQRSKKFCFKEQDSYKVFHKLNSEAIRKTLEIFKEYPNITSYKIPSRGRELYKFLKNLPKDSYNYKESQYFL